MRGIKTIALKAFSLHSFMNTEDDKEVDWEDFFNVKVKNR